jgi:plasmid stabilization system protein ParE
VRLVLLPAAVHDLAWVKSYYDRVFPEGAARARPRLRAGFRLIRENPHVGHPTGHAGIREFPLPRMPFSVIYRIGETRIEILRVWDQRADRAGLDL